MTYITSSKIKSTQLKPQPQTKNGTDTTPTNGMMIAARFIKRTLSGTPAFDSTDNSTIGPEAGTRKISCARFVIGRNYEQTLIPTSCIERLDGHRSCGLPEDDDRMTIALDARR